MSGWTVTTTTYPKEREWGARFEWLGMGYVLAIQVNAAPSLRVILFGWAIYVGKLLPKPQTIQHSLPEIAAVKGWTYESYSKTDEKRGDSNTNGAANE